LAAETRNIKLNYERNVTRAVEEVLEEKKKKHSALEMLNNLRRKICPKYDEQKKKIDELEKENRALRKKLAKKTELEGNRAVIPDTDNCICRNSSMESGKECKVF